MSETEHEPENFPDRMMFASMFGDTSNWESRKVQDKCRAQAKEVASYAARFRPGSLVFRGSVDKDRKKTWKFNEDRPSRQIAIGTCNKLALGMVDQLIISKHPVFKCLNILQSIVLMKRKKGKRSWNAMRNRAANHLMLVNMIWACDRLCLFPHKKNVD